MMQKKIGRKPRWKASNRKVYLCGDVIEEVRFWDGENRSPARFFFSQDSADTGGAERERAAKELAIYYVQGVRRGDIKDGDYCGMEYYMTQDGIEWAVEWAEGEIERREKQAKTKQKRERNEEKRLGSLRRAKSRIRRISNANHFCVMWTFTFSVDRLGWQRESEVIDSEAQKDCREVSKVWNKFMTRFRFYFGERPFVKVMERHTGSETSDVKVDTFHIHMACSFLCDKYLLQAVWGHGIIWYDDFRKSKKKKDGKTVTTERQGGVKNPGTYISKYIDKDFGALPYGMRNYSCSRSNKNFGVIRDERECKESIADAILSGYAKTFENDMQSEIGGKKLTVEIRRFQRRGANPPPPEFLLPIKGRGKTTIVRRAREIKEYSRLHAF